MEKAEKCRHGVRYEAGPEHGCGICAVEDKRLPAALPAILRELAQSLDRRTLTVRQVSRDDTPDHHARFFTFVDPDVPGLEYELSIIATKQRHPEG